MAIECADDARFCTGGDESESEMQETTKHHTTMQENVGGKVKKENCQCVVGTGKTKNKDCSN